MKKLLIGVSIGATHFGICKVVTGLTLWVTDLDPSSVTMVSWLTQSLVWLTRILYFPVLTLSLYKREWFPGDWVLIPMVMNSLIWAVGIYFGVACIRKFSRTR